MFNKLFRSIGIVIGISVSLHGFSQDSRQTEIRCGFDIGSGGIRVAASPKGVMKPEQVNLAIKKSVKDGVMPDETIEKIKAQLLKFKDLCLAAKATKFVGVATSGFRAAQKNGQAAIESLSTVTGIKLRILSSKDEAQLGFRAVEASFPSIPKHLVVWDIGGGSMQFSTRGEEFIGISIDKGAASFLNDLVCPKLGKTTEAIYPFTQDDAEASIELAKELYANVMKQPEFVQALRAPDVVVVGIGGVHQDVGSELADKTLSNPAYNLSAVEKSLRQNIGLNKAEIAGLHPTNQFLENYVTNLVLMKSAMETLGIKSIIPMGLFLSDGLLATETEWN